MKKKGSLSISINAIVTIILAMAALGVGLVIVNVLGNSTGDIEQQLSGINENVKKDLERSTFPVTLSSSEIKASRGEDKTFYFALRNVLDGSYGTGIFELKGSADKPHIYCDMSDNGEDGMELGKPLSYFDFKVIPEIEIDSGDSQVIPVTLKMSSSTPKATYSCRIEICNPKVDNGPVEPTQSKYVCNKDNLYKMERFTLIVS